MLFNTVRYTLYIIQSTYYLLNGQRRFELCKWNVQHKMIHVYCTNMSGGDLSRVNELSSEIDLDKQIVLKQHSRHVTSSSTILILWQFIILKLCMSILILWLVFWKSQTLFSLVFRHCSGILCGLYGILCTCVVCVHMWPCVAVLPVCGWEKSVVNTFKPRWTLRISVNKYWTSQNYTRVEEEV